MKINVTTLVNQCASSAPFHSHPVAWCSTMYSEFTRIGALIPTASLYMKQNLKWGLNYGKHDSVCKLYIYILCVKYELWYISFMWRMRIMICILMENENHDISFMKRMRIMI